MAKNIAIVGGGIIGLTTASLIVQHRPDALVSVFDQDMAGHATSFYSVGLGFPFARSERVAELLSPPERDWPELIDDFGINSRLLQTLDFIGLSDPSKIKGVLSAFDRGTAKLEPDVAWPQRYLGLSAEAGRFAALRSDRCYWGDVAGICDALSRWLRQSGRAQLHEATRIVTLNNDGLRPTLEDERGKVRAFDAVVLALGPFAVSGPFAVLAKNFGLRTKKVVALHINSPPPQGAPVVFYHDEDAFVLPQPQLQRWLFSFTCEEWDVPPAPDALRITGGDIDRGRAVLERFAPALADSIQSGRCFCDAFGPDRSVVVRSVDPAGRVVFAGAASGSGFRLAPGIASKVIATLNSLPTLSSSKERAEDV